MKAILLGVLVVLVIGTQIAEDHQWSLSSQLTLNLDYAARAGQPLASSQFAIQWNGKTIRTFSPRNYRVAHLSLKLKGKAGWNQIRFLAQGKSDSYGASITNVQLLRPSGCQQGLENLIQNGNFRSGHNLGHGWKIFKDGIQGWQGKNIEIGFGPIYNSGWKAGTYVCELDSNGNSVLNQWIYFDKFGRWTDGPKESENEEETSSSSSGQESARLTNRFNLRFNFAARQNVPLSSSQLSVQWNDRRVSFLSPKNYRIQTASYTVYARIGVNTLLFKGEGRSDGLGATISRVALIRGKKNLVKNGNFKQPNVGHGWNIFTTIPGWTGGEIEVGWGPIYNGGWGGNTQVCELDAKKNVYIVQLLKFDSNFNLVQA